MLAGGNCRAPDRTRLLVLLPAGYSRLVGLRDDFKILVLPFCIAAVAVCSCTHTPPFQDDFFEDVAEDQYVPIDFYASPKAVARPFREIDTVTVLGWGRSRDELIDELKERARQAGGEGVIVLNEEPTEDGRMNYSSETCESDDVLLRGVVIVYDEDGHLPPAIRSPASR